MELEKILKLIVDSLALFLITIIRITMVGFLKNISYWIFLTLVCAFIIQYVFWGSYLALRGPHEKINKKSWFLKISPNVFLIASSISLILIAILSIVTPRFHWWMVACILILLIFSAFLIWEMHKKLMKKQLNQKTLNYILNAFGMINLILYGFMFIYAWPIQH